MWKFELSTDQTASKLSEEIFGGSGNTQCSKYCEDVLHILDALHSKDDKLKCLWVAHVCMWLLLNHT